jgi:hypothetical protein
MRLRGAAMSNLDKKTLERFWNKVNKTGGCWLWQATKAHKYGQFAVSRTIRVPAHRLSYEMAFGKIPVGMLICHSCDNPICVNPAHLFCGTQSDNLVDCVAKGRHRYILPMINGERISSAKLTEAQVRIIRSRLRAGAKISALAKEFTMSKRTICDIGNLRTWKHVTDG